MHTVFCNLTTYDEFERKRYVRNYVGSSLHSLPVWIRGGCDKYKHNLVSESPLSVHGQFSMDQWRLHSLWNVNFPAFCSIIPGLQKNTSCFCATLRNTTHQPINLSSGISPKLMHVQLEMTSLRWRVRIADSTTSITATEALAKELNSCGVTCLPHVHFGLAWRHKRRCIQEAVQKNYPRHLGQRRHLHSALLRGGCRGFDLKSWTTWWLRGILSTILTMATAQDL